MSLHNRKCFWIYCFHNFGTFLVSSFFGLSIFLPCFMHCASSIRPPPSTSTTSWLDHILNPPQPPDLVKFWIFHGAIKHVIIYPSRLRSRANFYSLEKTSYHLFPTLGLKLSRLSTNSKDLNLHHHICTFVSTLGLRLFVVQNTTTRSTSVPWWYSYPFPFAHLLPRASKFLHQIVGMLFKTLFLMHCSFGSKPNLDFIPRPKAPIIWTPQIAYCSKLGTINFLCSQNR